MKIKIVSILCLLSILLSAAVLPLAAEDSEQSVQSIVYDFLTSELDLCPAAAAGIMGNVMIECGFDPDLEVIDTNDKPSYGLMMWNGPRYESLKKWCTENGYEKSDPAGQLGYLKWELENTEKAAYKVMKEIPNTIEGACRAAILWASDFERCTKTSYGLRIYYALNNYWQRYAGGTVSNTPGIYGYYYNVPSNIKYGEPLTLYGAVVSYSSELQSITAGVYTEDGELVTGKTVSASNLAGNIGVIDRYIVFNKVPRGSYYYTITAVNASGEYIVERHSFTVSDEPTETTLITESEGGVICELGATCPALSFKDMLPATHWAHDSVDFVLDHGYFMGNGAGSFMPKSDMTRAMAVTVLHRIANEYGIEPGSEKEATTDESSYADPEADTTVDTESSSSLDTASVSTVDTESASWVKAESSSLVDTESVSSVDTEDTGTEGSVIEPAAPSDTSEDTSSDTQTEIFSDTETDDEPAEIIFTDIVSGSWYEEHVLWAAETGLAQGKGGGRFDPSGKISRGELAVLLYRFAEMSGLDVSSKADLSLFSDGDSIPAWASDGLSWAVSAGLINGTKQGSTVSLDCPSLATREQVAAIILRFASHLDSNYN